MDLVIIWLCARYLGKLAAQKGLEKRAYQIMLFVCAISMELLAAMGTLVIFGPVSTWASLAGGLIGLATGTGIAFLIVRLLPDAPAAETPADTDKLPNQSPGYKFWRSDWVPLITILTLVSLLLAGGWLTISAFSRPDVNSDYAVAGVQLDPAGQIMEPVREISATEEVIYIGFDLTTPRNKPVTLTFDWYIQDELNFSLTRELSPGQVVVPFNREDLGWSEFKKGQYVVEILHQDFGIDNVLFQVK